MTPTMVSFQERVVLRDFVSLNWTGGDIVEIGAFCGASAVAILQGMNAAKCPGSLHVYDTFVFPEDHPGLNAVYRAHAPNLGHSFRGEFDKATEPFKHALQVHQGDAREAQVPEAISLLHFDCAISRAFHEAVSMAFFPKIPVGGYLIQQDYGYKAAPWIPEVMGNLQKRVKALLQVETSAYYKVTQPLTRDAVLAAFRN